MRGPEASNAAQAVVDTTRPSPQPSPPGGRGGRRVWRNYDEVFDLALDAGSILAATNGGLLRDGLPVASPSGLRSIQSVRPLIVGLADGRILQQEGLGWVNSEPGRRTRDLEHGIELNAGDAWPLASPPPSRPYAALRAGGSVYAGTSAGLYRFVNNAWSRDVLPSELPLAQPNGVARVGSVYVVGGLGGLFVGRPGAWRKAGEDVIRQIGIVGREVWAVHGNGAVDKIDPLNDRLYPDIQFGNAARPWASCLGENDGAVLFGGIGGWAEKGGGRFPKELKDDVVTALVGRGKTRWIGSQKSGLFRFDGARIHRWNPGNGLKDTWVTALLRTPSGLIVGTARRGLYRIVGDRITSLPSPTQRVTALALWQNRLVVGGMEGSWIGPQWKPLATNGEETTSIVAAVELTMTTALGVYFL